MQNKRMKPYKELNLMDRFLFDNVVEDPIICQDVLSICLGTEIPRIIKTEKEKTLEVSSVLRGIRLDIFSLDEENTVYNAEMQASNTHNLCKRSRYYQAHLDVSLLEPGEINFNKLNDSYMVMITSFDLFGKNRYRYTFSYQCMEDPDILLQDGAVKIFLNTKGTNSDEVNPELISFLQYVQDSSQLPQQAEANERLQRIHAKVLKVKENEELGVRYMQEWEERRLIEIESMQRGKEQGIKLGKEQGIELGKEQGIKILIQDYLEDGKNKEQIVAKLIKHYELSEEKAVEYFIKYGQQ